MGYACAVFGGPAAFVVLGAYVRRSRRRQAIRDARAAAQTCAAAIVRPFSLLNHSFEPTVMFGALLSRARVPRSGVRALSTYAPTTEVTTLPNRVRVATEATPGHFSAVGVYIDAGSRFERPWVPGESGVSHILDRMAFKVRLCVNHLHRARRLGPSTTWSS